MSAEKNKQGSDRRAFGRSATNAHAVAIVPGRPPMHCTVRDVSEGGALLDFGRPVSLPARLMLSWEAIHIEAHCEVRRIEGGNVGVLFLCNAGAKIAKIREAEARASADRVAREPSSAPAPFVAQTEKPAAVSEGASLVQKFRAARR